MIGGRCYVTMLSMVVGEPVAMRSSCLGVAPLVGLKVPVLSILWLIQVGLLLLDVVVV